MWRPKDNRNGAQDEGVPLELVAACVRGDEHAWSELVRRTYRDVYTLCLRILRDPDDAAEATQDAYLKAWRGLKGFRGDSLFSTWLYRVATNAAISKQRARARRWSREMGAEEEMLARVAAPGSLETEAGARLEVESVEKALASLPEQYRVPVVLRDVYGLSIEEIADRMKLSVTATKVRVHRGRKKLKQIVYPESSGTQEDRT